MCFGSIRWTTPETMSPSRLENSSNTISRSASRRRWSTTCFAVCAAMRPACAGVYLIAAVTSPSMHVRLALARVLEGDLDLVVRHVLHDRPLDVHVVVAGLAVDPDRYVALRFAVFLVCGYEGGLHRLEDHLFRQILLRR